ncbi:DUF6504 family protein [Rhizohabitans arisaemae]|uniref:DUF6504 family protein n=1 Tax=Rhizohabitans arisaemae TaxID=2720610 RepID=UPI0024B07E7B|nr:DUF6504 family protein [Rhizohabitans arisaemae]
MSRVYGDPIEAWTRDGRPDRFLWRDRLYTVERVLDHWVTSRQWWKTTETDLGERRFWRVEATPDREVGVYELRYDTASNGWLMLRVWD